MPEYRPSQGRRAAFARAVTAVFSAVFFAPTAGATETVAGTDIVVPSAIVVSADSIASAVGNQVLLDGGNAVDAAVAVGFALAVTFPNAGNIGGGGFMLIRLADGQERFIDYRETAPSGAGRDMYVDERGAVIDDLSTAGHLAVGVPGTVYGLAYAHDAYGTLPWKRLLEPAIRIARKGFAVRPSLARSLDKRSRLLGKHDASRKIFVTPEYQPGELLVQLDLAETLERIANDWRDFYTGATARMIAAEMRRGGGLITLEDLAAYHPVPREPVRFRYRGFDITSAPLPSSGGVILAQTLGMLERHDVASLEWKSAAYIHLVAEAEKVAYRGRALYLGDTDFYPSPWEKMIADDTVDALSTMISPDKKLKVSSLESADLLESEETTHYSIVDRWGNAVANTYTLNGAYGSGVVVTGAGFLLNNEMDDFAIKPGHPNLYGLVGSEANAIEPGKRMLSSMTPTFVYRDGGLLMVLGSPGGSTIPTTVLQVILNVIDRQLTIKEAVTAGRFHEQYLPDVIFVENGGISAGAIDYLLEAGHKIRIRKPIGDVQAILVRDDGALGGASDPRGDGRAVGH